MLDGQAVVDQGFRIGDAVTRRQGESLAKVVKRTIPRKTSLCSDCSEPTQTQVSDPPHSPSPADLTFRISSEETQGSQSPMLTLAMRHGLRADRVEERRGRRLGQVTHARTRPGPQVTQTDGLKWGNQSE